MSEDIMNALAALGADVANISAERSERSMRVTFDLLDPDDADLVRDVAEERGESDPRKRRIALCGSLGRENGVNSKGLGEHRPVLAAHAGGSRTSKTSGTISEKLVCKVIDL